MTFFVGTWATRLYTVSVLVAAAFMIAAGPGYGSVLLIALTSPVSIIFAPVFLLGEGWLTGPMMVGSVVAGYLLNTVLINMIALGARRSRAPLG